MTSLKGKRNIYFCQDCGRGVVTIDRDDGVTPFMIPCGSRDCQGHAMSFFYRAPQELLERITPAFEWYKPDLLQIAGETPAVQEHIAKGGLLMRRFTKPTVTIDEKGVH